MQRDRRPPRQLAWARLIWRALEEGKSIHLGRCNSGVRLEFGFKIGAETADGTFLGFSGGEDGLRRVSKWVNDLI